MEYGRRIREGVGKRFTERKIKVGKSACLKLDKKGFFVIGVDKKRGRIVVDHYSYDRKIKNKLSGKHAKELCEAIAGKNLVGDLTHAAYLGCELMKAEIALMGGLSYKQDGEISFK